MNKPLELIQLSVDMVLFYIVNGHINVLLIQRSTAPYRDQWALPWWFVKVNDTVNQTVEKVFYRETGILCDYFQHCGIFSRIDRDPRLRVISLWYYTIVSHQEFLLRAWKSQSNIRFFALHDLPAQLAFDHYEIIQQALFTLQTQIQSQWNIVQHFLPRLFTLSQLQYYCEIIYNRTFEKRNFQKFVQSDFTITKTNQKEVNVSHRPAYLYKFV